MARTQLTFLVLVMISAAVPAQAPEPPVADTRLTIHTLVREDIFAGFLQNDLTRLARAEKNIELLLASRPADRAGLLAWQGSTALTRAVNANDARQSDQFRQHYRRSQDLFAEAMKLGPNDVGVFAIIGGTQVTLADRLPATERKANWELGYTAYQRLWTLQEQFIEKLPLHHKGEVLSGLAQTAQRTDRADEAAASLDRILALMPDTVYANRARQWKDDPSTRTSRLACQTCHAPGTLVARLAEVSKPPVTK
jgi:tetratricopeptide (TPR) repeat protein